MHQCLQTQKVAEGQEGMDERCQGHETSNPHKGKKQLDEICMELFSSNLAVSESCQVCPSVCGCHRVTPTSSSKKVLVEGCIANFGL